MKCKYEIENIFPSLLSFDEIKEIVCKKIARLIILEENIQYDNK